MSDTDSFIEEVSEEVRRDRLYGYLRRYGWIGVVVVLVIVGGASYFEYQKSQARASAEALGDRLLSALQLETTESRVAALSDITPQSDGQTAVLNMLAASEQIAAGQPDAARNLLDQASIGQDVPEIYRQIAEFKAMLASSATLTPAERRIQLDPLTAPGNPFRLLAEEQIALADLEDGRIEPAIDRLQTLLQDAETSAELQRRAAQLIIALGEEPNLPDITGAGSAQVSN